jgi:hypothetical protein
MIKPPKSDAKDIEYETFDQYIGAEFMVNSNRDSVDQALLRQWQ